MSTIRHCRNTASSAYKAMENWVNASTVIITTPTCHQNGSSNAASDEVDYNVMMLQRSSRSSFYPNAYVFPGGRIDKADCLDQWLNVYQSVNQLFVKHLDRLQIRQDDGCRPPMFLPHPRERILREVSYRICAIRETFEETGVLLARSSANGLENEKPMLFADCYQFDNLGDLKTWQKRVHNDANQFLELCTQLKCVPDVWGLHEWSNWLTPSQILSTFKKRFDTVFYKAALSTEPHFSTENEHEIAHIIFNRSKDILKASDALKVILGPPQMYELARLANFNSHLQLANFAAERGLKGLERWLPVLGITQDQVAMSLYPGDFWYPEQAVAAGDSSPIKIKLNYEDQVKTKSEQLNHMKFDHKRKKFVLASTCKPRHQHIKPIPVTISMSPNTNTLGKL